MSVVAYANSKIVETKSKIDECISRFGEENNLVKSLKIQYFKYKTSLNTYNNLGTLQIENARKNKDLPKIAIESYQYLWRNRTAIGIAFGRSLSKNIEHLQGVNHKYKTIACDKSMKWLFENGIIANVYTTLDASVPEEWIPDDINLSGCVLFAHAGASHSFCKRFIERGGDVSFYVHFCMIRSHIELAELAGVTAGLPVSGNVGHATVVIASDVLAAKKLILIGYDNSWSADQYYADKKETGNINMDYLKKVIGIDGNEVFTDPGFMAYNHYLKEFIRDRKFEKKVINCSGSGILDIAVDDFNNY